MQVMLVGTVRFLARTYLPSYMKFLKLMVEEQVALLVKVIGSYHSLSGAGDQTQGLEYAGHALYF